MGILPKQYESSDVYTRGVERIRTLYERFDDVSVSFSGGKDSTVSLHLTLDVARELGRLPLKVYFFDEEAIQTTTIDYVRRVSQNPEIDFTWLCLPVKHRNACSRRSPWWYPWEPGKEDLWVREFPPEGIHDRPDFKKGMTMPDFCPFVYPASYGLMAHVRGLRAEESINRYRAVARTEKDNWIGRPAPRYYKPEGDIPGKRTSVGYTVGPAAYVPVSPIYDWTDEDVWLAPQMFGWDYNRTYDLMSMAGISLHEQRVCPPFGEEPLRGLWQYAVCFPDIWQKMCQRVPGANAAARYSQTELYGFGKLKPPPGVTWQKWTYQLLDMYTPQNKQAIAQNLKLIIQRHKERSQGEPIPETQAHPVSGASWMFLAMVVSRGDMKGRRNTSLSTKGDSKLYKDKIAQGLIADPDERRRRPREGGTRYDG